MPTTYISLTARVAASASPNARAGAGGPQGPAGDAALGGRIRPGLYVAEINAANRECGARQATLTLQEQAKLGRQIRKSATPWNSSRTGRAVP